MKLLYVNDRMIIYFLISYPQTAVNLWYDGTLNISIKNLSAYFILIQQLLNISSVVHILMKLFLGRTHQHL